MKPIETKWHGYRFRSRLEARWAVVFEAMGIGWEYEPEGFELSDGTIYLPDFRLRGLTGRTKGDVTWVEVKGDMTEDDLAKVDAFFGDGNPILVLGDLPDGNNGWRMINDLCDKSDCSNYIFNSFTYIDHDEFNAVLCIADTGLPELQTNQSCSADSEATYLAYLAGKYARFEHGELPESQDEFVACKRRIEFLRTSNRVYTEPFFESWELFLKPRYLDIPREKYMRLIVQHASMFDTEDVCYHEAIRAHIRKWQNEVKRIDRHEFLLNQILGARDANIASYNDWLNTLSTEAPEISKDPYVHLMMRGFFSGIMPTSVSMLNAQDE